MNSRSDRRTCRPRCSRRAFQQTVLGLAAGAVAGAAGSVAASATPAGKYVDVHVHLTLPWADQPDLDVRRLLAWMDQNQVAQAVVLPLISPEAWHYAVSNDYVLDQTRVHRQRLIPFCDIDPRATYLKPKAMAALMARYVAAGARGLGEHKCGVAIDDPRNLDVFRVCSDLQLPVLLHMDSIRNVDEPGLPGLEKALRAAPQAKFIGHATAWWNSISGGATRKELSGYPKGRVQPGGALDRLMDQYPNVFGDLSAGSGLNAIQRDPDFGREFLIRRADRLLFGSDYLAEGQAVEQFALLASLDLPAQVQAKIYRENARRILKA